MSPVSAAACAAQRSNVEVPGSNMAYDAVLEAVELVAGSDNRVIEQFLLGFIGIGIRCGKRAYDAAKLKVETCRVPRRVPGDSTIVILWPELGGGHRFAAPSGTACEVRSRWPLVVPQCDDVYGCVSGLLNCVGGKILQGLVVQPESSIERCARCSVGEAPLDARNRFQRLRTPAPEARGDRLVQMDTLPVPVTTVPLYPPPPN